MLVSCCHPLLSLTVLCACSFRAQEHQQHTPSATRASRGSTRHGRPLQLSFLPCSSRPPCWSRVATHYCLSPCSVLVPSGRKSTNNTPRVQRGHLEGRHVTVGPYNSPFCLAPLGRHAGLVLPPTTVSHRALCLFLQGARAPTTHPECNAGI